MDPGKELFLERVRIPFQLCAARIRVVILENELTGNQAQLQRIAGCRGRGRSLTLSGNRLTEAHVKELVEVDAFHKTYRINLGVVDQVCGVERICLLTDDKRQAGRRGPAHESPSDEYAVVIVSARDGRILRVRRSIITCREHYTAEEIALELEVGSQTK